MEIAERYADGRPPRPNCDAAYVEAFEVEMSMRASGGTRDAKLEGAIGGAANSAAEACHPAELAEGSEAREKRLTPLASSTNQSPSSVRDIFGNPFRPVTFSPTWRTDTAVALARQMYESRDFSAMPILADALQDAGCDNDDILDHCRGDGPHVRGCWVVDLVLGKG